MHQPPGWTLSLCPLGPLLLPTLIASGLVHILYPPPTPNKSYVTKRPPSTAPSFSRLVLVLDTEVEAQGCPVAAHAGGTGCDMDVIELGLMRLADRP